uniref:Doublecortin domain-containing protein n=1 Tax=Gouania willdenowi TaxID=441366 RepID=A0A8C5DK44_GOUWI
MSRIRSCSQMSDVTPSCHASLPPSSSRLAHVTSAAPAKRITFYKSGDSQFEGVRMAVHKRSFKCFDALLDDLSQKVPLPFGVRTVTTPRGTHTIKHLEQLQDGGCYLCSDQRQAKPINMEMLNNKRANVWHQHSRRPHRPESSKASPGHAHLPYRQRRILLVSNMDPGLRRSVLLSRRSTRSLGTFLEEASQLMQFHVRKLYTSVFQPFLSQGTFFSLKKSREFYMITLSRWVHTERD